MGHGRHRKGRSSVETPTRPGESRGVLVLWTLEGKPCRNPVIFHCAQIEHRMRRVLALRSFNWVAECVELARMRDHGKTAKELAGLFGYEEKYLTKVAALGFIPGLSKLAGCLKDTQNLDSIISNIEARDHLLPLRVWPSSVPKNDKSLDYSLYDYSECVTAIDLLASGELSPENLPAYSAERREAIARAQERAR